MAVLVHNGNRRDYYADMGVLDRVADFLGQRSSDAFKLVGNITSGILAATDPEPAVARHLALTGRTASRVMGDGIDAVGLPGKVRDFVQNPTLPNATMAIDSFTKLLKWGNATKVWNLGQYESRVQIVQNVAGVVTCGHLAINDVGALRAPAPAADAPAFRHEAHNSKQWGKLISLVKNVARVALNVLAFAGGALGIVTWSPLMLGLATVGTVGSIASFFFKQNAEIIVANGERGEARVAVA